MKMAPVIGAALIIAAPFAMVGDRDPARVPSQTDTPGTAWAGTVERGGAETAVVGAHH